MKLKRVNKNSRHGVRISAVRINSARMNAARLNKIVFVVALLWLVTSALMLFFYQSGPAHGVQPGGSRQLTLQRAQAAVASSMD